MEVARLFQVMPITLKALPIGEYRKMTRYYNRVRDSMKADPDSIDVDAMVASGRKAKELADE